MGFRLPQALWARAAPTWNDTVTGFPGECVAPFRERELQGEVSDGNAYALGGVQYIHWLRRRDSDHPPFKFISAAAIARYCSGRPRTRQRLFISALAGLGE